MRTISFGEDGAVRGKTSHENPLMKLLAIPLSNQKTVAKWLVNPNPD